MRFKRIALLVSIVFFLSTRSVSAQWSDARLIASQVAFGFSVSFIGKLLIGHEPVGRAFKQALVEGSVSGLIAHSGYCIAGREPKLALLGKTLAQKSSLTTRRSMSSEAVFDRSFLTHWHLTHSFLHIRFEESLHLEIDILNAAGGAYFLTASGYDFDLRRTLYSGSLFFRRQDGTYDIRGYTVPGVIWIRQSSYDDPTVLGHELVHTLQNERGAAIVDWHYKGFRLNVLALAPGVPALLGGWPEHDDRLHEREADAYAGR
jgi:hypothetical protein